MDSAGRSKIKKERTTFWIQLLICFGLALIPRIWMTVIAMPVRTPSDELATMAGAAYFAGNDWSAVVSHAGYYGTGFYAMFFWVFKLTSNPVIIYKVLTFFAALTQAITAVIAYVLFTKVLSLKHDLITILASVICSLCVVTRTGIVYNEHPLIMLCWLYALSIALCIKYRENKVQKFVSFTLCSVILGYGLTIHLRFSVIAIATVIVWLLYYFVFGERLFKLRWIILTAICLACGRGFITIMQNKLWLIEAGEKIRNSEISITTSADLADPETWKAWLGIVIGQLITMNIAMLGLFFISVAVMGFFLIRLFHARIVNKQRVYDENTKIVFAIFLIFLLSTGATIFAQSITWLGGVTRGLLTFRDASKWYSYKALTYVRYAGPYVGPLIFSGISVLLVYRDKWISRAILLANIIFMLFGGIFYKFYLPLIKNNVNAVEAVVPWAFKWNATKPTNNSVYITGFVVALIVGLVIFLFWMNYKKIVLGILAGLLLYQFVCLGYRWDQITQSTYYQRANDSYAFIRAMSGQGDLPGQIYVEDYSGKKDHQSFFYMQFWLNRYQVIPEAPAGDEEEVIFMANRVLDVKRFMDTHEGYQFINLDPVNEEYVLIKGERLQKMAEDAGYFVSDTYYTTQTFDITQLAFNVNLLEDYSQESLITNGQQGYVLYGPYDDLEGGEYTIGFDIDLIKGIEETLGFVEVVNDSNQIYYGKFEFTAKDFDNQGHLHIPLSFTCDGADDVEYRVWVSEGTQISVGKVTKSYNYRNFKLFENAESEADKVANRMQSLGMGTWCTYVCDASELPSQVNFTNLQNRLDGYRFSVETVENIMTGAGQTGDYILTMNESHALNYIYKDYVIVGRYKRYTLLARRGDRLINAMNEQGIEPLSDASGIKAGYYRYDGGKIQWENQTILTTPGLFEVSAAIGYNDCEGLEGNVLGYMTIYYKDKVVQSITVTKDMFIDGRYTLTKQIQSDGSNIRVVIETDDKYSPEVHQVYYAKHPDTFMINLDDLTILSGRMKDRWIEADEEKGLNVDGPRATLTAGKYVIRYAFEMDSGADTLEGECRIFDPFEEITLSKTVWAGEMLKGNYLTVDVPLTLEEERMDLCYQAESGEKCNLRLMYIEVIPVN